MSLALGLTTSAMSLVSRPHTLDPWFQPALLPEQYNLRIVSREMPWVIDVVCSAQPVVTCGDVFVAIYGALQAELTDGEWAIVDQGRQRMIECATRMRNKTRAVEGVKRVDWLGDRVVFLGLTKDDTYARTRAMPGRQSSVSNTWVAVFGMDRSSRQSGE